MCGGAASRRWLKIKPEMIRIIQDYSKAGLTPLQISIALEKRFEEFKLTGVMDRQYHPTRTDVENVMKRMADESIQIHRLQPPALGVFEAHSSKLLEPRPKIPEIEQGVTVTFVDTPSISGEIEAFTPHKTRAKVRIAGKHLRRALLHTLVVLPVRDEDRVPPRAPNERVFITRGTHANKYGFIGVLGDVGSYSQIELENRNTLVKAKTEYLHSLEKSQSDDYKPIGFKNSLFCVKRDKYFEFLEYYQSNEATDVIFHSHSQVHVREKLADMKESEKETMDAALQLLNM